MNLKAVLLWRPDLPNRAVILLLCLVALLVVGYVHTLTGLAYEFHLFFILPVMVVSWFNGKVYGYGFAVLTTAGWFLADRSLASDQAEGLAAFQFGHASGHFSLWCLADC